MFKAFLDGRSRSLAQPQFFSNTLENQHVRVDTHTDRQDDAGDSRQRQRGMGEAHKSKQNHEVQEQCQVGIDARPPVVDQHEDHDRGHTRNRGDDALVNARRTQRRPHGARLGVRDRRGERACPQLVRQVSGLLLREAAGYATLVLDRGLDGRHFADLVIEHDGHLARALIGIRVLVEAVAGIGGQRKSDVRTAILVPPWLRVTEVRTFNHRRALQQIRQVRTTRSIGSASQKLIWRNGSNLRHGFLFVVVGAAYHCMDRQLRRRLDDLLHHRRIVDAGQLQHDLVFAQAVLLNHRLQGPESVDAVPDRVDRVLQRGFLLVPDRLFLHRQDVAAAGVAGDVISGIILPRNDVVDGAVLGRLCSRHRDLLRMGQVQLGSRAAGRSQHFVQALHVAVGGAVDGFLNRDLEHQVRSTLEIESQVDVSVLQRFDRTRGRQLPTVEDPINEDHQNREDKKCLALQIAHLPVVLNLPSRVTFDRRRGSSSCISFCFQQRICISFVITAGKLRPFCHPRRESASASKSSPLHPSSRRQSRS